MGAKTPVETSQILFLNFLYAFQLCSSSSSAGRPQHEYQDKPRFPGALNSYYTEKLEFDDPDDGEAIPVYRVMDRNGKVFNEAHDPKVCCWFFYLPFLWFFSREIEKLLRHHSPRHLDKLFSFFASPEMTDSRDSREKSFLIVVLIDVFPWHCLGGVLGAGSYESCFPFSISLTLFPFFFSNKFWFWNF